MSATQAKRPAPLPSPLGLTTEQLADYRRIRGLGNTASRALYLVRLAARSRHITHGALGYADTSRRDTGAPW